MTNLELFNNIFSEVFSVNPSDLNEGFNKDNNEDWDSVRQLNLTSLIEDKFDIMLDPEDILDFTSYSRARSIMKKYDIEL